jgi:hypothetical protein
LLSLLAVWWCKIRFNAIWNINVNENDETDSFSYLKLKNTCNNFCCVRLEFNLSALKIYCKKMKIHLDI